MLESPQEIDVRLRPGKVAGAAEAWLLPGSTPAEWLPILRDWPEGGGKEGVGLLLPLSMRDRTPSGMLWMGSSVGPATARAQAYRQFGRKLWLPCDAQLDPPMSAAEVDALLPHDEAIFHPGIGLVGFDSADRVSLKDLISVPLPSGRAFSSAHPGVGLQDRLYAVTAAPVERVSLLLEDVRSEMGQRDASELPATPEEAREKGVAHWRRRMKERFLKAVGKLAKGREGGSKEKAAWRHRLETWTEERVQALRRDQERELKRLLHLMKTDPDEGLKFALPLGGGSGGGSDMNAGSELPERDPDFRLNDGPAKGGSGGAPWVVDWQRHYELSRQYREAANRELRLARFRRAAYIYAELLKDYRAAANALRQGLHYREASVLYLKHLGDPLEGARCLREGGFLHEAIPIFERKKQFETVAKLYEELGDRHEAERFYRLAVSRAIAHGNTIQAANLLEKRLKALEEAARLLQKSWPRSADAVACLRYELALYERHGSLEHLGKRMDQVTADHPPSRAVGLMEVLVRLAHQCPDRETRAHAERCSFVIAGRWLGSPKFEDSRSLLEQVRLLVPSDRLMRRDTQRFQQQMEAAAERRQQTAVASDADVVAVLGSVPMPSWVQWAVVEPRGRSGFYALGTAAQGVTLMRYRWEGAFQTQLLPHLVATRGVSRCRLAAAHEALPEVLSILGTTRLEAPPMPPADAFGAEMRVENPSWVEAEGFLGMTYGGNGVAWVLQQQGDEEDLLVLSSFSSMGDLIATHTVRLPFGASEQHVYAPIPMQCFQEQVLFIYGRHLIRFYRDRIESLELADTPLRIQATRSGRALLALCYESGVEVLAAGEHSWGQRESLELDGRDTRVTFTRTGDVLALSPKRLDVLIRERQGYAFKHTEPLPQLSDPLGIFPTDTPNRYALVGQRDVSMVRVKPWGMGR